MPPHRKHGHKSKRVKMNGVHMNGEDWSDDDDDGVKSGSATGFSEAEGEEGTSKKMFPKKYDPVNMLLDRIDAELNSLTKSQSSSATGSTVIQKPGSGRSSESNHDELTTSQLEHSGGSFSRPGNRSDMTVEGPGLDPRKIHGTVEIYSDAANMTDGDDLQRPSAPSDLDSLAAQQVDQKFKAILRKKKGGYLENLRASYPPSETDTIRTEDYEQRFRNAMVYSSGAVNKNETIPEEESETLPQRMITLQSNSIGSGSNPHADERHVKESPKRKHRSRQLPYPSDAESVKTEDFEVRFQELLVKTQESGMDTGLESDINDPLHRKVQAILKVSSPYKGKSQKKMNGYHDNTGIRMTKPDLDDRSSPTLNSRHVVDGNLENLQPQASGEIDSERRSRSHSPRRDSKPPTRTALNLSASLDRTPSYEDLSASLPPGRPIPLAGRFSPSPMDRPVSPMDRSASPLMDRSVSPIRASPTMEHAGNFQDSHSHSHDRSGPHQQRSSSPFERSRQFSNRKDFLYEHPKQAFTPERRSRSDMFNSSADKYPGRQAPERSSSNLDRGKSERHTPESSNRTLERPRSALGHSMTSDRSYQERSRSNNVHQRSGSEDYRRSDADENGLALEQSRSSRHPVRSSPSLERDRRSSSQERQKSYFNDPKDRNDVTENDREPNQSGSLYDRTSTNLNSQRPFDRKTHNMYERPRSARERSRTLPEHPIPSEEHPQLSQGRVSPSLNSRGSFRNSEDKLSVSFQDVPTSSQDQSNQDGRQSPSHLDLAYNRKKPPLRSSWVSPPSEDQETNEASNDQKPRNIRKSLLDLRSSEKQLKEYKALVEDAKTQLMLTEFKRDNTQKDLERMKEDLNRKKREVKNCEDQLRSRLGELRQINPSEMDDTTTTLLKENESLKHRLRQADGLELERDELVRQLELAKEDLFNEQRQSRHKIEELKEEIENLTMQIDENNTTQDEQLQKLQNLQEMSQRNNRDRNDIQTSEELQTLTRELRRSVTSLQDDIKRKDDIIGKLREQVVEIRKQLDRETSAKESLMDDHKRSLQNLRKEMDSATVQLRESLFLEKQQSLEELRSELERERRDANMRVEEKLSHSLSEHQNIIKKKEEEVNSLMQLISKMEEDRSTVEQRIKEEASQKIEAALANERQKSEMDQDLRVRRERELLQHENKQRVKDLVNELEQEKKMRENLCEQVTQANKDMEDQKQQNTLIARDRMLAVNRAKDQMRHEMLQEIDRTKEKLKMEHRQEIERLEDTIRRQEEELCQLRAERKLYLRPELENTLERVERTIVNEINEECRRNSNLIGANPRKVNLNTFRVENNGYSTNGRSRTPTTAALANLRACNQDLRNHVHELKQEIQHQKSAMMRNEREKEELIKNVKFQIEQEKNVEFEKMKQRLSKEVTSQYNGLSLHKPNNDVASMQYNSSKQHVRVPPYQFSPREDMQQIEIERLERQIRQLADTQKRMINSPPTKDNSQTEKMLNQLQSKVSHLQEENKALRNSKYNSYSVPDLSNPVLYRSSTQAVSPVRPSHQEKLANFLEQRSREGILDSETAEEHQKLNRNMMSQKMAEMTRLQNSLTNQAKDLIHLSKSYQQLNSRSSSPVKDFIKT